MGIMKGYAKRAESLDAFISYFWEKSASEKSASYECNFEDASVEETVSERRPVFPNDPDNLVAQSPLFERVGARLYDVLHPKKVEEYIKWTACLQMEFACTPRDCYVIHCVHPPFHSLGIAGWYDAQRNMWVIFNNKTK